jgi:hypothetical protein
MWRFSRHELKKMVAYGDIGDRRFISFAYHSNSLVFIIDFIAASFLDCMDSVLQATILTIALLAPTIPTMPQKIDPRTAKLIYAKLALTSASIIIKI